MWGIFSRFPQTRAGKTQSFDWLWQPWSSSKWWKSGQSEGYSGMNQLQLWCHNASCLRCKWPRSVNLGRSQWSLWRWGTGIVYWCRCTSSYQHVNVGLLTVKRPLARHHWGLGLSRQNFRIWHFLWSFEEQSKSRLHRLRKGERCLSKTESSTFNVRLVFIDRPKTSLGLWGKSFYLPWQARWIKWLGQCQLYPGPSRSL